MSKFTEVLKACDNFKKTTYYWDHNSLTHEENSIRNYPAPWITKTVELLKIIEGNVVVEIGSTRRELSQNCIAYHNDSMKLESKDAPPCCQDGHSTYFWVREGFEVHTVDIDTMCLDTDFDTDMGGKDRLLTPYLLENGYIKVLWGRQTVFVKNADLEKTKTGLFSKFF